MRPLIILSLTLSLAACAPPPEVHYALRSIPPGSTREEYARANYDCAKDAMMMAPTQSYREYAYGPIITQKMPDKRVRVACMGVRGYEFTPLSPGETPVDPWTGKVMSGWRH
jgi:hypothetical protein